MNKRFSLDQFDENLISRNVMMTLNQQRSIKQQEEVTVQQT